MQFFFLILKTNLGICNKIKIKYEKENKNVNYILSE